MTDKELYILAKKARDYSYSPYSDFKVGSAIETDKGVYTGTNIENASYPVTVCAERVAIFNAVSKGDRNIVKIAVASSGDKLTPPCGMCLQVISELAPKAKIILGQGEDDIKVYDIKDLLPMAFSLEDKK